MREKIGKDVLGKGTSAVVGGRGLTGSNVVDDLVQLQNRLFQFTNTFGPSSKVLKSGLSRSCYAAVEKDGLIRCSQEYGCRRNYYP